MLLLKEYTKLLSEFIELKNINQDLKELYDPIFYFLSTGGKKIRATMCLMACDLFSGNLDCALRPALAIEYFHNFTLIHDDIIDQAPIRRNNPTIHKKYNLNTAILSGDILLIKSYQLLDQLPNEIYKQVVILFSQIALTVCQGQQMDIDFETKKEISIEEYITMITYKTAVLGAFSFKLGAILANAKFSDINLLYQSGINLGIAFQIMDDYLDVFSTKENFGKKYAGDIYKNKKTILYLLALKNGSQDDRNELNYWYSINSNNTKKIFAVKKIFKKLKVDEKALQIVNKYNKKSAQYLNKIENRVEKKKPFLELLDYIISRTF